MFTFTIKKAKLRAPTKLEALSDKMASTVSLNLVKGIRTFKKRIPLDMLEESIKTNSIGHIIKNIPWQDSMEDIYPGFKTLEKSFEMSAMISREALPSQLQKNLRMDLSNPRYKNFISSRFDHLMRDLNEDTQKIVQRAIQRSLSKAKTPNQIANEIVDHIGLNDRQSIALMNYQSGLESKNVSPKKIEALTERYSNQLLKQRATTIARTEIQNANNRGQLAVWTEAQNEGLLNMDETFKIWQTDRSPCPSCKAMNGKKVKLNEKWVLSDGRTVDVPSENHPNCYCFQTLEL